MRAKRAGTVAALVMLALAAIGLLSNVISADEVEKGVRDQCESSVAQTTRLWRLQPSAVRRLPPSAIRTRTEVTSEGKRVTFQVPPNERPPFFYAHSKQVAPFVLRVRYGWAVAGDRMAFGHGGEQLVFSLFGFTRTLRDRPEWNF
jgi:hypothetical protein